MSALEIDLTEDQRVLVDASSRFIDEIYPTGRVRERGYDEPGFGDQYRRQAGELGWFSLLVAEEFGGGSVSGDGALDAALIAYGRGRGLQPGAFIGTNVVARALSRNGTDEQRAEVLPALMAGQVSASWLIAARPGNPDPNGPVRAERRGDGYVLSGHSTFVEFDRSTSWILVSCSTEDGPTQFLVPTDAPGLTVVPCDSLDLTRQLADVELVEVERSASALVGPAGGAADDVADQLALACVLLAAESVGAMDAEFEMTLQYAKDRIAFGRPIGSFQGIKHQLADTSLALEMSKAIVLAAARHVGGEDGYGCEAASMAKAFVGDAGIELAQTCFQVFGGIGFTWEHDQHLYLRRLTTDAAFFGNPSWHRERLCQLANV